MQYDFLCVPNHKKMALLHEQISKTYDSMLNVMQLFLESFSKIKCWRTIDSFNGLLMATVPHTTVLINHVH